MNCVHRYVVLLAFTALLAAPISTMAAPGPQAVQIRVYDRDHRDYHNWDDREDRAYRGYLIEQHQTYRVYAGQNHRRQREYWNWRHSHPDTY